MSKLEQMQKVEKDVTHLKESPLYIYRTENKYVPVIGEGNLDANIVFVGEAPGKNEAQTGRPFCGASGSVLDELFAHINLNRTDIYITNIVKDRPEANRDPSPVEIDLYAPFLIRQFEIIKPKVIAPLGRFSSQFILEYFGLKESLDSISNIHGKVFNIKTEWGVVTIIPLFHPAVAVYNRKRLGELKSDFEIVQSSV